MSMVKRVLIFFLVVFASPLTLAQPNGAAPLEENTGEGGGIASMQIRIPPEVDSIGAATSQRLPPIPESEDEGGTTADQRLSPIPESEDEGGTTADQRLSPIPESEDEGGTSSEDEGETTAEIQGASDTGTGAVIDEIPQGRRAYGGDVTLPSFLRQRTLADPDMGGVRAEDYVFQGEVPSQGLVGSASLVVSAPEVGLSMEETDDQETSAISLQVGTEDLDDDFFEFLAESHAASTSPVIAPLNLVQYLNLGAARFKDGQYIASHEFFKAAYGLHLLYAVMGGGGLEEERNKVIDFSNITVFDIANMGSFVHVTCEHDFCGHCDDFIRCQSDSAPPVVAAGVDVSGLVFSTKIVDGASRTPIYASGWPMDSRLGAIALWAGHCAMETSKFPVISEETKRKYSFLAGAYYSLAGHHLGFAENALDFFYQREPKLHETFGHRFSRGEAGLNAFANSVDSFVAAGHLDNAIINVKNTVGIVRDNMWTQSVSGTLEFLLTALRKGIEAAEKEGNESTSEFFEKAASYFEACLKEVQEMAPEEEGFLGDVSAGSFFNISSWQTFGEGIFSELGGTLEGIKRLLKDSGENPFPEAIKRTLYNISAQSSVIESEPIPHFSIENSGVLVARQDADRFRKGFFGSGAGRRELNPSEGVLRLLGIYEERAPTPLLGSFLHQDSLKGMVEGILSKLFQGRMLNSSERRALMAFASMLHRGCVPSCALLL